MSPRAFVLAVLGACSFTHGSLTDDASVGGDVRIDAAALADAPMIDAGPTLRQKTITVNFAVIGIHTNFPMWLTLTDADLAARAEADASDIHFTNTDGTDLPYEIQTWNKATGRLDAWVRVPLMFTLAQLAVRYGDITAAHPPSPATVFGAYTAVWHLEDALTNTMVVDAKGSTMGTAVNLLATDQVPAQLGGGFNFDNGTDQVTFANALTGTTPHTISFWIDQRATTDNDAVVVVGNGAGNQARWIHSRFNTAEMAVGFYNNDWTGVNNDVQGDSWTLVHWVFEGGNRTSRVYRDGTLVAGPFLHATGIDTQGTAGYLGGAPGAFGSNMGLTAKLDEVRILANTRNAEWIAAEALNQKTPTAFYTVGSEQVP